MIPYSSTYRVLSVSADANMHAFLRHALHVSDARDENEGNDTEEPNLTGADRKGVSFALVCVDTWQAALEIVAEEKSKGTAFSLIFLAGGIGEADAVRNVLEKIWECDDAVWCILCMPVDWDLWTTHLSLSRPQQWAVLRTPGRSEEVLQLASCLSACSPSAHNFVPGQLTLSVEPDSPKGQPRHARDTDVEDKHTELGFARDELATSKVYVENILRSMADSLLVINADLTIGSVNRSLLDLLGYSEDELIGQSPGCIFGEEFSQGTIIENLLLQGSVSGIESSFLTHDGRQIPISVSGSMMQDEQGQFQGLVCVAQDITERKCMEEEKLQLHEKLLNTSRQLGMAEVATGVLHNVGNVLNSINVSIGVVTDILNKSMVGDVGRISQLLHKHRADLGDFFSNNPKGNQVPGYLEKLSGQLMEEKRAGLMELDRLRENAEHAKQCVAAQQDLAKPSGMTEPISLPELVEEALAVNHDLLEALQVNVTREFQETPQIILDKRQVLQIMVDVIRNACQAMESVSVKQLVVRMNLIPGPPDSVCLEVQDSGRGIPPEDLIKIFGQGFNTQNDRRGMSLHSGSLVAKNMGGALRAHSEGVGHGATFFLELPGNFHFPDI